MSTMIASTTTESSVGVTATVLMMSAATSSSSPSRMARPSTRRNRVYIGAHPAQAP